MAALISGTHGMLNAQRIFFGEPDDIIVKNESKI
jgi:hypothetical protein